jgi:hypothetical protein
VVVVVGQHRDVHGSGHRQQRSHHEQQPVLAKNSAVIAAETIFLPGIACLPFLPH